MKCFLGIDLGSISTKGVLIDEQENIVDSLYLRSRDIESSLKEILDYLLRQDREIVGAGVTGSGREYAKSLIQADIVKTEIIAHAVGSFHFLPQVRTIIDIGGEDSKLILLENKVMRDFTMNTICSAGMGASMENIAVRLGIRIEDFGDLALNSQKAINLPMKCGVLMSSAVVSAKNRGSKVEDILKGVARAVARNFLALCAKGKKLEEPILFCGMTAHNKALVEALEEEIGRKIIVPEKPELMGALGIALIAKQEMRGRQTSFNSIFQRPENYKIIHHRKDCISCGNCFLNAPEYFVKDKDDGKSRCVKERVEEKDLNKIKEISQNCPMKIIKLEM
jgi:predicted CoA-substrate-specific enzyme activase